MGSHLQGVRTENCAATERITEIAESWHAAANGFFVWYHGNPLIASPERSVRNVRNNDSEAKVLVNMATRLSDCSLFFTRPKILIAHYVSICNKMRVKSYSITSSARASSDGGTSGRAPWRS